MREGIVWLDVDGRVTHANPSVLNLLGYTLDEICTISMRDIVGPEHLDAVLENRDRMRSGEDTAPVEREWLKKDGSKVLVEVWASMIFRNDETATATIVGVLDLTGRKAAQAQLQESEERYRDLFNRAPIAYMPCSSERILDANPKAEVGGGKQAYQSYSTASSGQSSIWTSAVSPAGTSLASSGQMASPLALAIEVRILLPWDPVSDA